MPCKPPTRQNRTREHIATQMGRTMPARKHNARSNISRRSKPILAALIILSLAASMVAISSSSSARAYASQSVSYNCGRTIYYGDDGWFTHFMDCDGAYAYCVQPRSKVPANGSYQKTRYPKRIPARTTSERFFGSDMEAPASIETCGHNTIRMAPSCTMISTTCSPMSS